MKSLIVTLTLGAALWGSTALAATGCIKGKLQFYQNQGNYCPSGSRDCYGANYLDTDWHTNQPITNAKVYLRGTDGSTIIGQSVTDSSGNYTIQWSTSSFTQAQVVWFGEEKDNRFSIRDANGNLVAFTTSNQTLTQGNTCTSPQTFPTFTWGNSTTPNARSNLFDGASRMWADALSLSNRMKSYFTDVRIRSFSDNGGACTTSCAYGSSKLIYINSESSAYMPQGRVLHEMGHIASHVANPGQGRTSTGNQSCYPNTTTGCGWSLKAAEWSCLSFEEGLATFYGDKALYAQWARVPTTCLSSGTCSTTSYNTETSTGTTCATDEGRWAFTLVRYLWDIYDSQSDYTGESLAEPYYSFFDTINNFGTGTGEGGKNEPWNSLLTSIDDRDGRSGRDFRTHFLDLYGKDTVTQYTQNCSPVGD